MLGDDTEVRFFIFNHCGLKCEAGKHIHHDSYVLELLEYKQQQRTLQWQLQT
jgi:hypothetical protein